MEEDPRMHRVARFYFGGLANSAAVVFTHPVDLMKVMIQTQATKLSLPQVLKKVVKEDGFLRLYNGISATLLRQVTYAGTRFGLYEKGRKFIDTKTFGGKVILSFMSGYIGGIAGTPADVVSVRMQNDVKLPPEQRRNYKHCFDGMARVMREEGALKILNGWEMASARGGVITLGQIAFYEQIKYSILNTELINDGIPLHLISSSMAAIVATILAQPLDVVKVRRMNAAPGEYKNVLHIIVATAKEGPLAFYKGLVPAALRLVPNTVLTFVLLEKLRFYFGIDPPPK